MRRYKFDRLVCHSRAQVLRSTFKTKNRLHATGSWLLLDGGPLDFLDES